MKIIFKNILYKIYKIVFAAVGKILPRNDNLIIFESFLGRQYSDNPRAIYEYLMEKYPSYNMYWSIDKKYANNFKNFDIKYAYRFSLKWMFLMNRAKYWVVNSRLPLWIPKPKNTIYIQTWHGTPLKKLGMDIEEVHMPNTNTERYKQNFTKEASKWDYLISPNKYSTEIFKRAFRFNNSIIETGYPRNDYLINKNTKEEIKLIKDRLNLPLDKKIILYAPTWRDNQYYEKGRYKFQINLDLDTLKKELGDEYIFILRLHYLIAEKLNFSNYKHFIYDFSYHDDIRELYLISDLLITDYSSVFFDYANLKRPMIFYVFDIEDYRDKLRGFYFDFEKNAPGPLVKNTNELIKAIRNIEQTFDEQDLTTFYNKFCYLEDGRSTERVVNYIFKNK